jgi:hypothetical protein
MKNRSFNIGDRVICIDTYIVGKVIKFYYPTASEEQTMVETSDGRQYHAPTRNWILWPDVIMLIPPNIGETIAKELTRSILKMVINKGIELDGDVVEFRGKRAYIHVFDELATLETDLENL